MTDQENSQQDSLDVWKHQSEDNIGPNTFPITHMIYYIRGSESPRALTLCNPSVPDRFSSPCFRVEFACFKLRRIVQVCLHTMSFFSAATASLMHVRFCCFNSLLMLTRRFYTLKSKTLIATFWYGHSKGVCSRNVNFAQNWIKSSFVVMHHWSPITTLSHTQGRGCKQRRHVTFWEMFQST